MCGTRGELVYPLKHRPTVPHYEVRPGAIRVTRPWGASDFYCVPFVAFFEWDQTFPALRTPSGLTAVPVSC